MCEEGTQLEWRCHPKGHRSKELRRGHLRLARPPARASRRWLILRAACPPLTLAARTARNCHAAAATAALACSWLCFVLMSSPYCGILSWRRPCTSAFLLSLAGAFLLLGLCSFLPTCHQPRFLLGSRAAQLA